MRFLKVATDDNTADLFSKPLNWNHFVKLRLIVIGRSVEERSPRSALPVSQGASKVYCVNIVKGPGADKVSSSFKMRRGSPLPEDLCPTSKNTGKICDSVAVGNGISATQCSLNGEEFPLKVLECSLHHAIP